MRRWPAIPLLLALLLVGRSAAPACGQAPADSPVARALAQGIDLDLERTPLDKALAYVAKAAPGLNLSVGEEVKQAGIDLAGRTVDLKVRGVAVRHVLELVLGPDLGLKVETAGVRVTTHKWLLGDLSTASYAVGPILAHLAAEAGLQAGEWTITDTTAQPVAIPDGRPAHVHVLLHLIEDVVSHQADFAVALWSNEGGAAEAEVHGTVLTVRQTARGHERVAELVGLLDRALAAVRAQQNAGARLAAEQQVIQPEEPQRVAETRRRLQEPFDLDCEKTSLDNILKYIGEVEPGLSIVIDPVLATAGLDLSTRVVDLNVRRVAVGVVLDLSLGPHLAYEVRPGFVQITAREFLEMRMPVRLYPVADLLKAAAAETARCQDGAAAETAWGLADLVLTFANKQSDAFVAAWSDEGGPVVAQPLGGVLIVAQTPRGHEQVLGLLNQLRQALRVAAAQAPVLAVMPPEPESAVAVRRGLDLPIDVDFDRVALNAALGHLAEARRDLNLVIDAYLGCAGIDPAVLPVTLRLRQVPMAAVLDAILKPQLTYSVGPGYVLVTTREAVQRNVPLDVYPMAKVMRALGRTAVWRGWQEVVDMIQRSVNQSPDPEVAAWTDEGGSAGIGWFGGQLVVTQTPHAHARLAALLDALLAALAWQEGVPEGVTEPVQRVFVPADARAAAGARLLDVSVDVGFRDVTLEQAVRTLSTRPPGLNVVLDERLGAAGIDPAQVRVTVAPGRRPLGMLLKEMLPSTVRCCTRPGYVLLTTREVACQAMPLVLYPARDLVDRELRCRGKTIAEVTAADFSEVFGDLANALRRAANASADPDVEAWADEGGPAELMELGDVLIVRQTGRGQSRVLACLNDIRAGRLVLEPQSASPSP